MDATCRAMEQLLSAVEMGGSHSEATTPTATTTISIWSAPSEGSGSSSMDPVSFRFHLDGQPILPPLMTSAKKREVQLARQMAEALEKRYRLARHSAGSDMASRRSVSQLQQTETLIYDSTRGQARPQTLVFGKQLPTIQVDPPTPQPFVKSIENTSPRRHNRITDRILQFEQSGLGKLLPKVPDKCILRTSPAVAEDQQDQDTKDTTARELGSPLAEPANFQRSRSFTLEEPSQVLVEHMEREALAVKPSQSLANFEKQTIESQAKRVNRSARSISSKISHNSYNSNSSAATKSTIATKTTTAGSSCSRRDREVERIIERALDEHGALEASRKAGVRNYLRGHRERMNQLVIHQEKERRRMQAEFDHQQRQLIEELCAEIDVSSATENPDSLISQSTSTGDLQRFSPSPTLPSFSEDIEDFPTMEDKCQIAGPSSARKRLFSPKPSKDSEPQLLSAPSTPRSLPLRNSSLTNSRRSVQVVRRRSQSVGGSLVKTITAADREVKKSPAKPGGGAGRPKSSPGKNSSIIAKRGNAPPKSASPTKRLGNRKKP
uniref:AT22896p n=1 Tax=Drosophila melanogaster TaxID=7227 RepID=F0JAK4_DROME|nr:AT22896p [Drosophila melanogaster]